MIVKKFHIKEIYEQEKPKHDKVFIHKDTLFCRKDDVFTIIRNDRRLSLEKGNFFLFYNSLPYLVEDITKEGFLCLSGFWKDVDFNVIIIFDNNNSVPEEIVLPYSLIEDVNNLSITSDYEEYKKWLVERLRKTGFVKKGVDKLAIGKNWDILPPLTYKNLKRFLRAEGLL